MSEERHTPGPWEMPTRAYQGPDGDGLMFSGGDWNIYPPLGESGPVAVAAVKEDAQLIAAAPDLLAALIAQDNAERLQANCEECDGEGEWAECELCSQNFGEAIDLRQAAIKKAKGE